MFKHFAVAALTHAANDGGLAMVLAYQAIEALREGRLKVVLREFEPPPRPVQIVSSGDGKVE